MRRARLTDEPFPAPAAVDIDFSISWNRTAQSE